MGGHTLFIELPNIISDVGETVQLFFCPGGSGGGFPLHFCLFWSKMREICPEPEYPGNPAGKQERKFYEK